MIAAKTSLNRAALLGGAATFVLALVAPTAVLAQAAPAQTAAADDVAAEDEGTIVVTGSLIKNPNLISAAPVTVTSAEAIQLKASNVAEEVIRDIPGVVPSIGSSVNNGNGGASFVDLRGIGSNRNIVLLDGNRIAPSGLVGRVDLNNIPLALVQSVESLTGAAVTTYGADAISGVVNFVTKQDFSGVDLQISNGLTERGDGRTFRADLTIGGNFADGKGNATLSLGYQTADPVYQGARDFSAENVDSFSGFVGGGSNTSVPTRFSGTRPFDTTTGRPSIDPAVGNGNLQYDPALGYARSFSQAANGRVINGNAYSAFNFNPYNIYQTPFKRFNIFATAKYDVSDALTFYTRGLFSKNQVNTIIAPSGIFGQSVTINLNNPFLPVGLRNQFCATNIGTSTNYIARFDQATCDAAALATGRTDARYREVTSVVGRRSVEVGPRISQFGTTIFDYRAGLKGKLTNTIDWDVNGSYGESENVQTLQNYVSVSRARNSFLVNGTLASPSCQNGGSDGCVATNWFGPAGSISDAAANYLRVESTTINRTSLAQLRGLVSGDFGVSLPTASDPLSFAVGAEYRDYFASQRSDLLSKTPGELGGAGGAAPDITGGYNVTELYGEIIAPIAQDKPFFHNLTIEAGARYSSYTVTAPGTPSYDTFTWKAGGTWEFVEGYKIRGNFSKAVRAPNISELFSPQNTGLTNLASDPCAGTAPVGNATLRQICINQGAPANTIGLITQPTAGQANLTTGGNLGLKPETAFTWTVGAVLIPPQIPGLTLTVDYYNIRVKDAVSSPTSGDIINACFGGTLDVNNPACAQIQRNPALGTLDGDPATTRGLLANLSNLGDIRTDGVDVSAAYSRDIGFAKLGLQANMNWTFSQTFNANVTAPGGGTFRECVGFYSADCSFTGSLQPKFQSSFRTTLGFDWVDVSLLWRHISGFNEEPGTGAFVGTLTGNGFLVGQNVDFTKIPAYDYLDLSARFHANEHVTVIFTVTNLTDRDPPLVGATVGSTSFNSGNTYPSTYTALGRRYNMQINVRF